MNLFLINEWNYENPFEFKMEILKSGIEMKPVVDEGICCVVSLNSHCCWKQGKKEGYGLWVDKKANTKNRRKRRFHKYLINAWILINVLNEMESPWRCCGLWCMCVYEKFISCCIKKEFLMQIVVILFLSIDIHLKMDHINGSPNIDYFFI